MLRGIAFALLSLATTVGLRAQAAEPPGPNELINYAYAADSGFGGFEVSGRSVQAYRIPISFPLRALEENRWGAKLTLPVSFGVHDLRGVLDGDERFRESFRTVTFVPGVEFELPVADWVVKPFAEMGYGKETSAGGEGVFIYAAGVQALYERPSGRNLWSFGAGAEWNGVSGAQTDIADEYRLVEGGVEFRYPLGASFEGKPLDSSVYATVRRFSDLLFPRIGREPIEIDSQFEIGITFGTEPPTEVWGVRLPRIGLSYRFGGGLTAYRINFGFPF